MSFPHAPLGNFGLELKSLRDGIQREFHTIFVEETKQAPEARSAAVLVLGLRRVVALVDPGRAAWVFTQVGLGDAVTV